MRVFSQVISSFFLLTDFNILAELLISCLVFKKCDAMADLSVCFNLRFLKCFVLMTSYVCLHSVFMKCCACPVFCVDVKVSSDCAQVFLVVGEVVLC